MSNTLSCDLTYKKHKKLRESFGDKYDDFTFYHVDGSIIMGSQLKNAKDGCEIQKILGWHHIACQCPEYNQCFQIIDKDTDLPAANLKYQIIDSNGSCYSGMTDESGYTEKVHTEQEKEIKISLYR